MDLEDTFYIMAIIYMAIMFLGMIVAVCTVVAIKRKINAIHDNIEQKLHTITNIAEAGANVVNKAKQAFGKNK